MFLCELLWQYTFKCIQYGWSFHILGSKKLKYMKEKQDNNLNPNRGLHKCSKELGEIITIKILKILNLTLLPKIALVSDCQYVFKPLTER